MLLVLMMMLRREVVCLGTGLVCGYRRGVDGCFRDTQRRERRKREFPGFSKLAFSTDHEQSRRKGRNIKVSKEKGSR